MTPTCPPHQPVKVTEEHFGGLFTTTPAVERVWYYCDRCGERCDAPAATTTGGENG